MLHAPLPVIYLVLGAALLGFLGMLLWLLISRF
jgi:hypothetical protein